MTGKYRNGIYSISTQKGKFVFPQTVMLTTPVRSHRHGTLLNSNVQVPALTSPLLDEAITETMDITRFICKRYPQLAPLPHVEQVMKFLDELHDISYFSLTFCNKQHGKCVSDQNYLGLWIYGLTKVSLVPRGMAEKLKGMIEGSQYPERYREALKQKLDL